MTPSTSSCWFLCFLFMQITENLCTSENSNQWFFLNFITISGTLGASLRLFPNVRVLWQTWCFHAHKVLSLTGIQLNIYLRKSMWHILYIVFWPKQVYLHPNYASAFSSLDTATSPVPRKWCSHSLALSSSFECIKILDFFGFIIMVNRSILLLGGFTLSTSNLANIAKVKCQF